jgi:hypothetical protein
MSGSVRGCRRRVQACCKDADAETRVDVVWLPGAFELWRGAVGGHRCYTAIVGSDAGWGDGTASMSPGKPRGWSEVGSATAPGPSEC